MPEEPLRVLELSTTWGLGGTEQAIEIRAALLPPTFFDVAAVGVYAGGPRLERLAARGIRTQELGGDAARFEALVSDTNPHVVHYSRAQRNCEYSQLVQDICRRARVPVLVETNIFGRPAGWDQSRPPDLTCHMSLASMLRCARQSGQTMGALLESGHRAVYLPVPTEGGFGAPTACSRAAVRADLGVQPTEILAIRVTRPDIRKWSTRLELALPRLFEAVPQLRFAFMAAPEVKEAELKSRFGSRVLFLKPTSDLGAIRALYTCSDLMIHSSGIGESFGLCMAEAMANGLPVIVDSTPEMDNAQVEVVEHGHTGLVVASSAGFLAATQLLAFCPQLRSDMGRQARERAVALFSDQVVVRQWERLYLAACLNAGVPISGSLRQRASSSNEIPASSDYGAFEKIYEQRCRMVLGTNHDPVEFALGRWLRARDTIAYARQIGPRAVLNVVSSRLRSTGSLRRD